MTPGQYYIVGNIVAPGDTDFFPLQADDLDDALARGLIVVATVDSPWPGPNHFQEVWRATREDILRIYYGGADIE